MVNRFCRRRRCILAAAAAWFGGWIGSAAPAAAQAAAQPPMATSTATWPALAGRLSIGDRVYVTDTAGATTAGTLTAVTDAAVDVKVDGGVRSLAAADVRRIQSRQADSPLNGILIGAGFGAIPGDLLARRGSQRVHRPVPRRTTPRSRSARSLGGLIDRAVTRRVTVDQAGASSSSARRLLIGPLIGRKRLRSAARAPILIRAALTVAPCMSRGVG